jgi:hypothetical protein
MNPIPRTAEEKLQILCASLQFETDVAACKALKVSRASLHRWWGRCGVPSDLAEALQNLTNRPPVHKTHPMQISPQIEQMIRDLRRELGWGSTRIKRICDMIGYPVSRRTVDRVLRQAREALNTNTEDTPGAPPPTNVELRFDPKKLEDALQIMTEVAAPRLTQIFRALDRI